MRRQAGLTLIEVLVVLAIIAILMALGMPALGDFLQNGRVKAVASEMRDGLLAARTEAIRCNKSVTLTSTGVGWSFTDCSGNTRSRSASSNESSVSVTYAAGAGTTYATFTSQAITFSGAGRTSAGAGSFNVSATGADLTLRVLINAGGLVRICNPNAATGAADAC